MHGHGCANGAGTIVNAIAIWKGAAFCIDLATTADVNLDECSDAGAGDAGRIIGRIENVDAADTALITRCVSLVLERFGYRCDGVVTTRSEIPIARGLKSSSAAANAAVLATLDAIGETLPRLEVVSMGVRAALDVGVTITGAFDDACASALGGIVITAYRLALDHDFENAMTLNGLLYCAALGFDTEIAMSALEIGVSGVSLSGTGSAYTALVGRDQIKELKGCWGDMGGSVIQTRIVNKL